MRGGRSKAGAAPTLSRMSTQRIDWSQLWYPGPKRAFSNAEMAAAGSDGPSPTLLAVAALNFAAIAFVVLQLAPAGHTWRLLAALVALALIGAVAAGWLWWRPWRRPLMVVSTALVLAMLLLAVLVRWQVPDPEQRFAMALALAVGGAVLVIVLWFLVVWRAQQIEARLREQAEREKSIEMARRLAAAQIEPHFLFNTLASVQHWVQIKDDRAATLLAALTGYLRATLPMFNRPLLALADELLAIEHYLQVMQLRMGARLAWRIDVAPDLRRLALPPGVLLTLVENAIVHGLEPRLAGGELLLSGRREGAELHFQVVDNGPGPSADMKEGVGLSNIRQRLALCGGSVASLHLGAAPGGGFLAELRLGANLQASTP